MCNVSLAGNFTGHFWNRCEIIQICFEKFKFIMWAMVGIFTSFKYLPFEKYTKRFERNSSYFAGGINNFEKFVFVLHRQGSITAYKVIS